MIGIIRTEAAIDLVSGNGRHGETVRELIQVTKESDSYQETLVSVARYGILSPILIRDEVVCNGTHRVTIAHELMLDGIPFTDDPEIGWANEFEWPEERESATAEKEACRE